MCSPSGCTNLSSRQRFRTFPKAGLPPLKDGWLARAEYAFPHVEESELALAPAIPSRPPAAQNAPAFLFNGIVKPLIPYAIKGVIWYQGESNASRAFQYRTLFPLLISDWRKQWDQGDFPFYFVQLANYLPKKDAPEKWTAGV